MGSLLSVVVMAGGCVALPDVQPESALERSIVIRKDKVSPSLYMPFVYPLSEPGYYWRIQDAVRSTPADLKTTIYWYYDFDSQASLPVGTWEICGGKTSCFINICKLSKPSAERHRLWAVVASGEVKEGANAPFDFADDVVFDAVIFEIETKGTCP